MIPTRSILVLAKLEWMRNNDNMLSTKNLAQISSSQIARSVKTRSRRRKLILPINREALGRCRCFQNGASSFSTRIYPLFLFF